MIFPVALHLATMADVIQLSADATRVSAGVIRVHETIPAAPGKLRLAYPKFLPGHHAPSGLINDLVDLKFSAAGKTLAWRRDPYDMYAFEVDVPTGATEIEARFAHVFDRNGVATRTLARIDWEALALYPADVAISRTQVAASLIAPGGWSNATALRKSRSTGAQTWYEPVSVEELVDSPAVTGKYYRSYPLGDAKGAPVTFDVFGETKADADIDTATIQKVKNLVKQAVLLGDGRHFRSYRFLMTFSDEGGHEGLEHHESSENGLDQDVIEYDPVDFGTLIGHEFFHSWNGKFRRPAGLIRPTFQEAIDSELLWVYEGLTEYYGNVLAARSGLISKKMYEDIVAAYFLYNKSSLGRSWRSLADIAKAAQLVNFASTGEGWSPDRRGASYYDEAALVWLDADSFIRQQSGGTKSLDDFVRLFHGGTTEAPEVRPYDLPDVYAALNQVLPHDWEGFFRDRIYAVVPKLPPAYLENAGFRLIKNNKANAAQWPWAIRGSFLDAVGFAPDYEGKVQQITLGGPAFASGMRLGDQIVAVNGKTYTGRSLMTGITTPGARKLTLKVKDGEVVNLRTLTITGGPMVPHLQAIPGKTDMIAAITKARS